MNEERAKRRLDLLEWIDALTQGSSDKKMMLQVGSPELDNIDPHILSFWLSDLEERGLIKMLEYPDFPIVKGHLGTTENDWFVFTVKDGFHDYVDTVYTYLNLTIENLSRRTFIAVLDTAYEMWQKFETTQSNTVVINKKANTKRFPQLEPDDIDYRAAALQFLQEYGTIQEAKNIDSGYSVKVTRRYFARTYQHIMTRAVQEGFATYKKDKAVTRSIAEESKRRQGRRTKTKGDRLLETKDPQPQSSSSTPTEYNLKSNSYDKIKGVLHLSPYKEAAIAKRGSAKKKDGSKYFECWLLECVFKTVNTQKSGANFSKILSVHDSKIGKTEIRKVRNAVDAINKKIIEAKGPKNLLKVQSKRVFVNNSYLL